MHHLANFEDMCSVSSAFMAETLKIAIPWLVSKEMGIVISNKKSQKSISIIST